MAENFIVVTDNSFGAALGRYAAAEELRGKAIGYTLEKVMALWISYALHQTPRGSREEINGYLMQQVTTLRSLPARAALTGGESKAARRRAETVDVYRNTLAARIVAALNIYGARGASSPAKFYAFVRRFHARRLASVNVHRASLVMPLKELKGRFSDSTVKKLRRAAHSLEKRAANELASVAVEAWGSARKTQSNANPKGMQGTAGAVFFKTMTMVEATMEKWTQEKIETLARRTGFQVPAAA